MSFFLSFVFIWFPSQTKSKYIYIRPQQEASPGGHKDLVKILNHEYCTLDLTPVAPHYFFFFLPSSSAATGVNLTVLVYLSGGAGGGQCKCTFKTGVTDSQGER